MTDIERQKQLYLIELYGERVEEALRMIPIPDVGATRIAAIESAKAAFLAAIEHTAETV